MAGKDFYTNIMLDLECASVSSHKPVIIELAAVYFDIETGTEFSHISRIINFQSCKEHGLDEDSLTMDWLRCTIPETLASSQVSAISLPQALKEFPTFVKSSREATRKRIKLDSSPRGFSQPAIWGNGANADNVWIKSAYKACHMEKPWEYYNDMCVRTFVKQCLSVTGRDFQRETVLKGKKHKALDDCRHQISYLVNARNYLMTRPRVERVLSSPVTSSSGANADVGEAVAGSSLAIQVNDPRGLHEVSMSDAAGDVQMNLFNDQIGSGTLSGTDGQITAANGLAQEPGLKVVNSQRRRIVPCKVAKQVSTPGKGWTSAGSQRRRHVPAKAPTQLLTPETSFSAEEYEKEYELGKQEDQRQFVSQDESSRQ